MFTFKKELHKIYRLAVFVIILFALAVTFDQLIRIYSDYAAKPLRELKSISIKDISCLPCSRTLQVKSIDSEDELTSFAVENAYRIREKPPGAIFMKIAHDTEKKHFCIYMTWEYPTFWGGKFSCTYIVTSSKDVEFLRNFVTAHSQLLESSALTVGARYLVDTHRDFLTKLGDGDPYIGLNRAGVFDWIKDGKDPEVEWTKKYSEKKD